MKNDAWTDLVEFTALPPLSPTMERAFSEAFADMSELEKSESSAVIKVETAEDSLTWPGSDDDAQSSTKLSTSSPTPASIASHKQPHLMSEIRRMSPSGGKKSSPKDSTEAKRARRSAIEKKSRQRRQRLLKTMRDEVKHLEDVYAAIARRKERGIDTQWIYESLVKQARPYSSNTSGLAELQYKFSELTLVALALEEDHEELQKRLQQHEEFEKTARHSSDESMDKQIWNAGVPPSSSFHVPFTKLTTRECYVLVRQSYEEIQRFNNPGHFESTGANFMGWTDKRKYDSVSGALHYGFSKKFPQETPEDLIQKTWEILTDALKFKNMTFDRSIRFRHEVLQHVNDDLIIVRRDHRLPHIDKTFAAVIVIFRLQTPRGYTMCMRSIPSPEIQHVRDAHEYFYDIFHWTHFNHRYDEFGNPAGCELMCAGSIDDQTHVSSSYWLFELVCSILRWESVCVAPLFLIQS
ncbi:hypothetical protein PsorP6_003233 [Peronosclerospora sorghi]|uniref:Uncharacterized protein n=1 Tax=Peronosclerospora sorghi TaxID=230839 RepID=A0ACC0VMG4_9STRA|nr:hypothetical protein PsorP6_003233 [Peronosclerospora sorghi]